MVTKIHSATEYHFEGTHFTLKNHIAYKIKAIVVAVLFFCGILTSSATIYHPNSTELTETTGFETEIVGLRAYISKTSDLSSKEVTSIVYSLITWGERFNIDPKLLAAIIMKESKFDPHAISPSGALGLMQIIPRWHLEKIIAAKEATGNPEIFNTNTNIYLGAWVMSDCLKKFKLETALTSCYSGGHQDYSASVLNYRNQITNFIKRGEV
jgi:hypothetical protein